MTICTPEQIILLEAGSPKPSAVLPAEVEQIVMLPSHKGKQNNLRKN